MPPPEQPPGARGRRPSRDGKDESVELAESDDEYDESEEETWQGASSFLPGDGSGFQDLLRAVGGGRALKQLREAEKMAASAAVEHTIFQKFDTDQSGGVDIHELKATLHEYGLGDTLDDQSAKHVFAKYDVDKNGQLDFDEFRNIVKELELIAAEKKVFRADIARLKARIRDQGRGLLNPRGQSLVDAAYAALAA